MAEPISVPSLGRIPGAAPRSGGILLIRLSLSHREVNCAFHEKAGRCQELISIPAISSYKHHLRHRGRGQSRPRCSEPKGKPGRVAAMPKHSLRRKWQAASGPILIFRFQDHRLCRHPSIRIVERAVWGSMPVGRSRFSGCCQSECRPRSPPMPRESDLGLSRSHPNSAIDLVKLFYSRGYYAAARFSSRWFRSGSYTSPLTHSLCSNTASFRATATTARFLALRPPR